MPFLKAALLARQKSRKENENAKLEPEIITPPVSAVEVEEVNNAVENLDTSENLNDLAEVSSVSEDICAAEDSSDGDNISEVQEEESESQSEPESESREQESESGEIAELAEESESEQQDTLPNEIAEAISEEAISEPEEPQQDIIVDEPEETESQEISEIANESGELEQQEESQDENVNTVEESESESEQQNSLPEEIAEVINEPESKSESEQQKEPEEFKLNYDFTSGERYVDKISTKTEFDKMLDELGEISNDLLSWQVEKFAKEYTGKFQGDFDKAESDAKKYEAFLGGYITNAAMMLYDNGYRDIAIKKLEQAKSIIETKQKIENETQAIINRVEENDDAVDLSDILGLFGD